MKKLFAIFLFSCFCISIVFAQDEGKTAGISSSKGDRVVVNFHTDLWQTDDSSMTISGYSPGFDIYGMYNIPLGKSKFGLALGFGVGTHNIRSNAMPVADSTEKTIFIEIPEYKFNKEVKYDINKLTVAYFDIPLELRFRTENKKGKAIKFSVGGKLGYLINSHTKYKGTDLGDGDGDVKYKSFKIPNLEPLRYGATLRFGYSFFNVYGYYSLSKLFKADKGPEMYPISVGIAFTI
jgi:hypothetical protein